MCQMCCGREQTTQIAACPLSRQPPSLFIPAEAAPCAPHSLVDLQQHQGVRHALERQGHGAGEGVRSHLRCQAGCSHGLRRVGGLGHINGGCVQRMVRGSARIVGASTARSGKAPAPSPAPTSGRSTKMESVCRRSQGNTGGHSR